MVIAELSIVRELARRPAEGRAGKALLAPVLLGDVPFGELPYDLYAKIQRIQCLTWLDEEDTEALLHGLRRVIDPALEPFSTAQPRGAADETSGVMHRDTERRPQPPKTSDDAFWYVERPAANRLAANLLAEHGSPVVVVGPGEIGKSYFVDHLLRRECGDDDVVLRLDFDDLGNLEEDSLNEILKNFGMEMVEERDEM